VVNRGFEGLHCRNAGACFASLLLHNRRENAGAEMASIMVNPFQDEFNKGKTERRREKGLHPFLASDPWPRTGRHLLSISNPHVVVVDSKIKPQLLAWQKIAPTRCLADCSALISLIDVLTGSVF
jgi:hypothetical protein